jgi:hypothetical protein
MAVVSGKFDSRHEYISMVSPSSTLASSLQHTFEIPKASLHKEKEAIIVNWDPEDPENPMNWSMGYRQFVSAVVRVDWIKAIHYVYCSPICIVDWLVLLLRCVLIQRLRCCHSRHHEGYGLQPGLSIARIILVCSRIWAGSTNLGASVRGMHQWLALTH